MLILSMFPDKLEENIAELGKKLLQLSGFIYAMSLRHKN